MTYDGAPRSARAWMRGRRDPHSGEARRSPSKRAPAARRRSRGAGVKLQPFGGEHHRACSSAHSWASCRTLERFSRHQLAASVTNGRARGLLIDPG
jgi:hypothetical protein